MSLKLGTTTINKAFLGSTEITKLYLGTILVLEDSEVNVLTNGTFDTDTDWTKGAGWSISGGTANGSSVTALLSQNVGTGVGQIESGETYKVILDVIEVSAGGVEVRVGGTADTANFNSVGNDQESTGIVAGNDGFFRVDDSTPAFTGKIDNIRLIKTS